MGLDMYLTKKTYIWSGKDGKRDLSDIVIPEKYKDIKPERIKSISEEVAYWRKANQIHKWFVENVQDDNDNCGEYYVDNEKLQELVNLCKKVIETAKYTEGDILVSSGWKEGKEFKEYEKGKVIANVEEIEAILPSNSGFFFGSTEYDEYYISDLENTIKQIEPLLKEEGDFYYSSSW